MASACTGRSMLEREHCAASSMCFEYLGQELPSPPDGVLPAKAVKEALRLDSRRHDLDANIAPVILNADGPPRGHVLQAQHAAAAGHKVPRVIKCVEPCAGDSAQLPRTPLQTPPSPCGMPRAVHQVPKHLLLLVRHARYMQAKSLGWQAACGCAEAVCRACDCDMRGTQEHVHACCRSAVNAGEGPGACQI